MTTKKMITSVLAGGFFFCASAQEKVSANLSINYDSATAIASTRYRSNSFLRDILMGRNYRKEWRQPVTLPVFHLTGSGFTIKELGGGMQTKSLHLIDSLGKQWSLRTVDKDVTGAMPPVLRNSLAHRASQDMISSAFPYGAPVAGELANAVGLRAARPQVFFVAADSAFGSFQSIFANTVCTLEERDPGFDSTDNSNVVLENITKDHRYKIQQPILLKARLLDLLMNDWDRHADNWRWGLKDSAGFLYYYAIPRDRDWAFYLGKGLVPRLAQLTKTMRHLVNFSSNLKQAKDLSWKAWLFDRTFLNELDRADWEAAVKEIQTSLTDEVIKNAVRKMPASIYAMDGENFTRKIEERRDGLREAALKYFEFLSEEVIINGSDREERFTVHSDEEGLVVSVFEKSGTASGERNIYTRKFPRRETYSITLNGLGGEDIFEVDDKVNSKIRLQINGGDGNDSYQLDGVVRIKVYDSATEKNVVTNNSGAKIYFR